MIRYARRTEEHAKLMWVPEEDDDLERTRGKRMVLRCKVHGITDDMILVEYGPGRSRYFCRKCQTKPCPEHGEDYVTLLRIGDVTRQVCIVCEPSALMEAADERNDFRRENDTRYSHARLRHPRPDP